MRKENSILSLIFLLSYSTVLAGLADGCWLPEKYASGKIADKNANLSHYSYPITSITVHNDKISIEPFGSEIAQVSYRKVDGNKFELLYLYNLFNEQCVNEDFSSTKFFLSQKDANLVLQIQRVDKIESVTFINQTQNYKFKSYADAWLRFELMGNYLDEHKFSIALNGEITNNNQWVQFTPLRWGYNSVDKKKNIYYLIVFKNKNRTSSEFAVKFEGYKILLYTFTNVGKNNYDIEVADTPSYVFEEI